MISRPRRMAVVPVLFAVLTMAAACEDDLVTDATPKPPTTAEGVEPTLERGVEIALREGYRVAVEKWGSEPFTDAIRGDFGDDFRIDAICRGTGELRVKSVPAGQFSRPVTCDEEQSGQRIVGLNEPIELTIETESGTMWKVVVAVPV